MDRLRWWVGVLILGSACFYGADVTAGAEPSIARSIPTVEYDDMGRLTTITTHTDDGQVDTVTEFDYSGPEAVKKVIRYQDTEHDDLVQEDLDRIADRNATVQQQPQGNTAKLVPTLQDSPEPATLPDTSD